MTYRKLICSASLAAVLAGCSGVRFVNSATNLPVPPTLQQRTLWEDTAIPQYKPEVLIGYVLEKREGEPWRRKKQFIPQGFNTTPEVIKDGQFYHSIVDSSIAGSGNAQIPILAAAAKLSSKQRMELTIEDAALLLVPDRDIPWSALETYVAENPNNGSTKRAWVQAVMLTKMYLNVASETSADATVSGAAFAADGKVFNQNSTMQRQPYITLLLVDLDQLEGEARGMTERSLREAFSCLLAAETSARYLTTTISVGGLETTPE